MTKNISINHDKEVKSDRKISRTVLIIAVVTTLLYLAFIIDFLLRTTDPDCVRCGGAASPWLLTEVYATPCKNLSLNELGDYFAGTTSFLVIFWIILAFIWQVRELGKQIKQLVENNHNDRSRLSLERKMQATSIIVDLAGRLEKQIDVLSVLRKKLGLKNNALEDRSITNMLETIKELNDVAGSITTSSESAKRTKSRYISTLSSTMPLIRVIENKWDESEFSEISTNQ